MFKEARKIMKEYPQHKSADQYTDNLGALHQAMWPFIPKSKKTLDIGSAYAVLPLMLSLRGDTVTASDMTTIFTNLKMLHDHGIKWKNINLEKDKKLPSGYDLITLTEVLEHLNSNPLPTIKKIYQALNPGGYVVCSTPSKEIFGDTTHLNDKGKAGLWNDCNSWHDIPEYHGKWKDQHTYHYDQFELVSLFTEAGFVIQDIRTIASFSHLIIGKKA
jgi:2-polyprenyl-3-methyl-5-hydroxy-6-metoxy-1,4-benzoquinol methylase